MKVVKTVSDALKMIDSYDGAPEDFFLPVSEEMLDPVGINLAIICDRILSRNWQPNGFEQQLGFRIYRYKAWD